MLITSSATQSLFDAIRQNTLQGATGLALWQAIRSEVFHFLCAEAARRLNRDGFGCRGLDAGEIASDVMGELEGRYERAVRAGRVLGTMFGRGYDGRDLACYLCGILRYEVGYAVCRSVKSAACRGGLGVDVAEDVQLPLQDLCDAEAAVALMDAVNNLPDADRVILVKIYIEGSTVADAGDALGLGRSQAYVRRTEALAVLRVALEAHRPESF